MSVIGYDLGNLNCVIAVARKRGIDVLANEASRRTTATMAGFDGKARNIGESASIGQLRNLTNTIVDVKRFIGRKFNEDDVQREIQYSPNTIVQTEDGGVGFQVEYDDSTVVFTPEQVVGMLLSQLQRTVDKETEVKGGDCVISVPGYFTDRQRRAIHAAAAIGGVNCIRLISENAAAALAYGLYKEGLPETDPIHVMFYDLGHSSLSVSIAAFTKGKVRIIASAYDRFLGGRDFDIALASHFADEFKTKYGIDIRSNKRAWFRTLAACEKLKVVLSANPKAPLNIECLMNDIDVKSMIDREDFNKMVASLFERAVAPVKAVLAEAGLTPDKLSSVELIGGSSRIPAVQEALKAVVGHELSHTLDKSETVARGCALQCAILSPKFRVREFTVQDSAPYTIQVSWGAQDSLQDEDSAKLFERNGPMPASKVMTFNRADGFRLNARYANPDELPGGTDTDIGTFVIPSIPACANPAETPRVKLKIKLDLSGLFFVESATMVETVVEPTPEPAAAAATTTPPATTEGNAEGAAAATPDAATPTPAAEPKTKLRSTNIAIQSTIFGEVDNAKISSYFEQEGRMAAQDRLIIETSERKNDVETYVYDMRSKISEGGVLHAFCTSEVRDSLLALLAETEDWLYGDGEDTTKSVYVAKLAELKKLGDPIEKRHHEFEHRPIAIASLRSTSEQFLNEARSQDEKYAHIDESEKQKVVTQCTASESWLNEKLAAQESRHTSLDPVLTVAEVNTHRETLVRVCRPILTKPKPAPPKEQPKPAEATPAPNTTTPPTADGSETSGASSESNTTGTETPASTESSNTNTTTEAPNMDVD